MKSLITITLILLIPLTFIAQNNQRFIRQSELDSLLLRVNEVEGKTKAKAFINISRLYMINNEDENAIDYGLKAVNMSNQLNFDTLKAMGQLFLGLAYSKLSVDSALKYYILSSDYLSTLHHPWAGFGYENAIGIYTERGWYPEALECALKAEKNYVYHKDTVQISYVYSKVADLFREMKQYDNCYYYLIKAKKLIKGKEMYERDGYIHGGLGIMFDEMEIYDSAFYYNELAIDYFNKAGLLDVVSQWESNIANSYIKTNEYDKAEKYLIKANDKYLRPTQKAIVYTNFANVYNKQGKFDLALKMLDTAKAYAEEYKQNIILSEVWYRSYELYEHKKDYKNALKYFIKYSFLDDSLLSARNTSEIAQLQIKYNTQEKEKEIEAQKLKITSQNLKISQAELKVSNKNKWIIGITFFGLSIILFILFFMQRNKRKAQQEKNRAILSEQEKGFEAVFNAQEEERARVAKDLHDGIGQQISAMSLNFQMLSEKIVKISEELKPETDKVKKMIQDAGTDVRNISHKMMPRALTEFGLVDALEDIIDKTFINSDIKCTFEYHNMEERLPKNIEIGLYRITQELINNIIKHSKASKVDIQLVKRKEHCILIVQDDGIGITNKDEQGIGIRNMKSRLNALKGQLNLESDSKSGTTAIVKIKIN